MEPEECKNHDEVVIFMFLRGVSKAKGRTSLDFKRTDFNLLRDLACCHGKLAIRNQKAQGKPADLQGQPLQSTRVVWYNVQVVEQLQH